MRRRGNLTILKDVRKHLSMETCGFDRMCGRTSAPTFEDGRAVTESNVTEFIRERTRLWLHSWVLPGLDEVITKLERVK